MTQQETREFIFKLINTLISKQCYIKGFGEKFRVCDSNHNPLTNISRQHFNILKLNKIVSLHGLIYTLDVFENPFKHQIEIQLPKRHEV